MDYNFYTFRHHMVPQWYPKWFELKFDISAFERTITRIFIVSSHGYIVRRSLSKNIVFGLQNITSSKFHFLIAFVLTIIVVTGVVEGPSTLTLEKIWYCTCEMKNLGTPETHPEELVVFKNERQYYKRCLLSDNSTTRSSSGWVLAIPKIYISKKYKFSAFNDCIGRPLMHSKSNDIFTMWKWIMPDLHASGHFIKLEIIKLILTWYRFAYKGFINELPKRRVKVSKLYFFIM